MNNDLKLLVEKITNINNPKQPARTKKRKMYGGTSKKPGSVLGSPYGTFRDLEQLQATDKVKKQEILGHPFKPQPLNGKLVGGCEESRTFTKKSFVTGLTAINEEYPNAVVVQTSKKYQILAEDEDNNPGVPPTIIGQGNNIQTAWINAEERINAKLTKFTNAIRTKFPMAVARKEGSSFWIKESPGGNPISYSRTTLLEAWQNAVVLQKKRNQ